MSNSVHESEISSCCEQGTELAQKFKNISCDILYEDDISSNRWDFRYKDSCKAAFEICCLRDKRIENCRRGQETAFSSGSCPSLDEYRQNAVAREVDAGTYMDCCFACILGINAAKGNQDCTYCKFGSPWNEQFYECCSKFAKNKNIGSTSTRAPCPAELGKIECESRRKPQKPCSDGFFFCEIRKSCIDINECELTTHACKPNQNCVNTYGSYYCVPRSEKCYILGQCGTSLVTPPVEISLPPCSKNPCKRNQICRNTYEGFECVCPPGKVMNDQNDCEDIEKPCDTGLRRDINGNCNDINECDENPCSQKCLNTLGSYECSCNTGYSLEADNKTCVDIDECDISNREKCICRGICVNTQGSFDCRCPKGYDRIGENCVDVNECDLQSPCDVDEDCLNIAGSYHCFKLECTDGYIKDEFDQSRCILVKDELKNANSLKTADFSKAETITTKYVNFSSSAMLPDNGWNFFVFHYECDYSETVEFDIQMKKVFAGNDIEKASISAFKLEQKRDEQNGRTVAFLYLMKTIDAPQEMTLELSVKSYSSDIQTSFAIVNVEVLVTRFEPLISRQILLNPLFTYTNEDIHDFTIETS